MQFIVTAIRYKTNLKLFCIAFDMAQLDAYAGSIPSIIHLYRRNVSFYPCTAL